MPVRELPDAWRRHIDAQDDDVIIGRCNSRAYSKLLSANAALLVAQFQTPKTIARAVARYSRDVGVDPETHLEEALRMLLSLIEADLIVGFEDEGVSASAPLPRIAEELDGWAIRRCVQVVEDAAVYQVRSRLGEYAALKIGRAEDPIAARAIEYEAHILSALDLAVVPRLRSSGYWRSRPYLITEWRSGTDAEQVCRELRAAGDANASRSMLALTTAILRSYSALHKSGVVHGDVHVRNVLIDRNSSVTILDFGVARTPKSDSMNRTPRAGVSFFFEPELAESIRAGTCPPPATVHGEQYSLAALIYFLLTGRHYLDFIVEKNEMLRQISEDPMLPFSARGLAPWPEAERVLRKALSKSPSDRFDSVDEFGDDWERLTVPRAWSSDRVRSKT